MHLEMRPINLQLPMLKFKESIFFYLFFSFLSAISLYPKEVFNSWNSTSHFCKWFRVVTCIPRHQRVAELNPIRCHLHGLLSPRIGNLSFFRIDIWHICVRGVLSNSCLPKLLFFLNLFMFSRFYISTVK